MSNICICVIIIHMSWQTRRKILYALALLIGIAAISVYLLRDTLFPLPTCFDGKQNGYEVGIDCGGNTCGPRCSSEVIPLDVLWSRALRTSKTTYDLVAMVSNKNINNASHSITYTFTVYDIQGQIIQEFKGETIAPVGGDFPIIIQSVSFSRTPRNVTINIQDGVHFSVAEKPTSPTLSVTNERYETGLIPRVYATIKNNKRITIDSLPVMVVLFDENNNGYAVGGTVIPRLEKEEVKEVSFTWDAPLPYSPIRIKIYPIFDPFLSVQ